MLDDDPCLRPGLRVQTYNRRTLGVIERIEGGRLLVRSPWRRSYWLPGGLVRTVGDVQATLHIDSRVVDRYRQPAGPRRGSFGRKVRVARVPLMCGGLAGVMVALVALL